MEEYRKAALAIREQFKGFDDVRDAGQTTPAEVVRYDDICYGTDEKWQVLDLYRPRNKEGELLPVIVSIHGGGWVYGDKERYQYYCMSLAKRGFAVVNFTYRLAPEFQYPASMEDTNTVFHWIMEHAEEYLLDTAHVFGVGDSAGGQQLSMYAAICTNEEYANKFPFTVPEGFVPAGVALNCGVYQFEYSAEKEGTTDDAINIWLPGHGTKEECELISTINYVTDKFPPVFLMSAMGDFLLGQTIPMAQKLTEQKVEFVHRIYGNAQKPLWHVFHCDMRMKEADECNDEECAFFKMIVDRG